MVKCVLYTNILDVNGKMLSQQQKCVAFYCFPAVNLLTEFTIRSCKPLAIYHKHFIVAIKQLIMRQMNGLVGISSIRLYVCVYVCE